MALMNAQVRFLILLSLTLALGVLIYFATGYLHVKKNSFVNVRRKGRYYVSLYAGNYYFWPWRYSFGPCERECGTAKAKIKDGQTCFVEYHIISKELLSESRKTSKKIIKKALRKYREGQEIPNLEQYGIVLDRFAIIER